MKKVACVVATLIILVLTMSAGCDLEETVYHPPGSDGGKSGDCALQILTSSMYTETWGTVHVEGTAKNVGTKRLDWAEVDVRFYDNAGHLVDTSFDGISDLDPGMTWSFDVVSFADDAASYDIGVGDSWCW